MQNVWKTILVLIAVAGVIFIIVTFARTAAGAGKKASNDFISGYDYTRTYLNPNSVKGKHFAKRLDKIEKAYGELCKKYMPDAVTECLIRILIESGGHDGSSSKDTYAREAGATSIGYPQAVTLCEEYQVCGDPCFDAEFAIGAFAWLTFHERHDLLTKHEYWSDVLPGLCADETRTECEIFIQLNFDTNGAKARKIINRAGTKDNKHVFWNTISWLRNQSAYKLKKLFGKTAVSFRRFGLRWGLSVQKVKIRKDRLGEYNWGKVLEMPPSRPVALYPMPNQSQWRKRCHRWKSERWWASKPKL